MHEKREIIKVEFGKLKKITTSESASWIVFGLIIVGGIIARSLLRNYTSTDIFVWKEAAEFFLEGKNPYEETVASFEMEGKAHFYAYPPLWMYICIAILRIFPEDWFFIVIKGLLILFDLGMVAVMYDILRLKVANPWRLKLPIALWFITPMVVMVSAMHGKFDSLLFLFILLACKYNEKNNVPLDNLNSYNVTDIIDRKFTERYNVVLEAIFLTLAILTKTIALMLVPFFYQRELMKKDLGIILTKALVSFGLFFIFSIPFLREPIVYFKGVLEVHITRGHNIGRIFWLLKLIFTSPLAEKVIQICLTVIIVLVWLAIIILAIIKKCDVYTYCLLAFIGFNGLYWVFLVQYIVWSYNLYVIVSTKSKFDHWKVATITGLIIAVNAVILGIPGLFAKLIVIFG